MSTTVTTKPLLHHHQQQNQDPEKTEVMILISFLKPIKLIIREYNKSANFLGLVEPSIPSRFVINRV